MARAEAKNNMAIQANVFVHAVKATKPKATPPRSTVIKAFLLPSLYVLVWRSFGKCTAGCCLSGRGAIATGNKWI